MKTLKQMIRHKKKPFEYISWASDIWRRDSLSLKSRSECQTVKFRPRKQRLPNKGYRINLPQRYTVGSLNYSKPLWLLGKPIRRTISDFGRSQTLRDKSTEPERETRRRKRKHRR